MSCVFSKKYLQSITNIQLPNQKFLIIIRFHVTKFDCKEKYLCFVLVHIQTVILFLDSCLTIRFSVVYYSVLFHNFFSIFLKMMRSLSVAFDAM
jgi:hypothetical protein